MIFLKNRDLTGRYRYYRKQGKTIFLNFWAKQFPFGFVNAMPVAGIGQTIPYCLKMIANLNPEYPKALKRFYNKHYLLKIKALITCYIAVKSFT
ncbi:hypothetical protein ACTJKC_02915 [Pedobacter sp. 22226]|uniref:hypothetical protein n=1 Tax=Pedobacter sp. 22226 TaxID=3453894 RepID=UPI003F826CED